MAFYKSMEKKTRQEKREAAFARGGFEDEGRAYKKGGRPNRREDEPRREGGYHENPKKRYLDGKNGYGEHMPRNARREDGTRREDRTRREDGTRREDAKGRPDRGAPAGRRYDRPDARPRPAPDKRAPRREQPENGYERYRFTPPERVPARELPPAPPRYQAPVDDDGDIVPNENLLSGRNPIREAIKSGRDIEKLLVARGELSGSAREIVQMARERRIPVQEVDRERLNSITPNHQGMLAFASAYQYSTVEDMLALAEERGEQPFLILLDGITDPHNLGAIIRSAECAGAHGVIVQERRAVGLTPAAVKASAGAVEYLPVARVTNLANTLQVLKARGIWAYAADMDGESYDQVDFTGGVALVIGSEGEGVGRRVLDVCDKAVSLPVRGQVDSLNASVAAGILMYAVLHSRA